MRALVTGISGQLGFYLARVLQAQGDQVYGLVAPHQGIHLPGGSEEAAVGASLPFVEQVPGDLLDGGSLEAAVERVQPDVVFALGALSQPALARHVPRLMLEVNALGMVRLLEAVWRAGRPIRLVHASTDEVFGAAWGPQTEETPVAPVSRYGLTKAIAHLAVQQARAEGLWAANAVLYNAISPRQTTGFAAYVCKRVAEIAEGPREGPREGRLMVETLRFHRDWSFAGDVARALVAIAAQDAPDDVLVGSGVARNGWELVKEALGAAGLTWEVVDGGTPGPRQGQPKWPKLGRLLALGWRPTVDFPTLIRWMVDAARGEADGVWPPGEQLGEPAASGRETLGAPVVTMGGEPAGTEGDR